jgi:hypothetical protein
MKKKSRARPSAGDWFITARRPLLDFTRNLTSQTLFAALAGLVLYRLVTVKELSWDPSLILAFVVYSSVFILSSAANIFIFFEDAFKEYRSWHTTASAAIKASARTKFSWSYKIIATHLRHRRRELALFIVWVAALVFILAAVVTVAAFTARGYVVKPRDTTSTTSPPGTAASAPIAAASSATPPLRPPLQGKPGTPGQIK